MWVGGQIGRLILDCLGGWMGITYVWCFLCKLLRLARLSALVGFLDLVSYLKIVCCRGKCSISFVGLVLLSVSVWKDSVSWAS